MMTLESAGALSAASSKGGKGVVKIKIIDNTVCDGKRVRPGDVVETTAHEARYLLALKKAEPYGGTVKKPVRRATKTKEQHVKK